MSTRAVLFDLDGTLLDTLDDLADSMNAVLGERDWPRHPTAAYRTFVGAGIETLVARALPADRRDEQTIAWGVAAMREAYGRRWNRRTRPYEGVEELLEELFARGLKVGILSNKPDDFTRLTTETFLGRWPFERVWGIREGIPKKPDPTAALAFAAELSIAPADTFFCGDTDVDMVTACAAGMVPVGVRWGFRGAEELLRAGARYLLSRPRDLLDLLQRENP
jgi:phosphoglycolate phosphatase